MTKLTNILGAPCRNLHDSLNLFSAFCVVYVRIAHFKGPPQLPWPTSALLQQEWQLLTQQEQGLRWQLRTWVRCQLNQVFCNARIARRILHATHAYKLLIIRRPWFTTIALSYCSPGREVYVSANRTSLTLENAQNYVLNAHIFGRPCVKRFALCYQSVVCLSVCPVCPVCPVCM